MSFKAFADDTSQLMIDDLTFENQGDRLSIYGSVQITADQQGLQRAKQLAALLKDAIDYLEAQDDLPKQLVVAEDDEEVENPFWQSPKS